MFFVINAISYKGMSISETTFESNLSIENGRGGRENGDGFSAGGFVGAGALLAGFSVCPLSLSGSLN